MLTRSQRLDGVADTLHQLEVDVLLAEATFSDGHLDAVERILRQARERLTRAIVTVKRRGAAGVR